MIHQHTENDWFDVPERPGYQVNCIGQVKSLRSGILLKCFDNGRGYIWVKMGSNTKAMYVHRIVAKVFLPNPHNLPAVNHKDLDKRNNHYQNLEWVSHLENSRHAHANGAFPAQDKRGSKNGNNKLTEMDVLDIRKMKGKKLVKDIAKDYNISIFHVYNVFKGNNWKHLNTTL